MALVGKRIRVHWPDDDCWYSGLVTSHSSRRGYFVRYDPVEGEDNVREWVDLQNDESWELAALSEQGSDCPPGFGFKTVRAPAPTKKRIPQPTRTEASLDDQDPGSVSEPLQAGDAVPSWKIGRVSEGVYLIDTILAQREHRGQTQYLIRWLGWSEEFDSWEAEVRCSPHIARLMRHRMLTHSSL